MATEGLEYRYPPPGEISQADDSEAGLVQLSHSGSSVLLGDRTAGRDGLGVNGEARSMTQKSEYVGNDQVMVGNGDSLPIANWYGFSFGPSGSISSFESVTCSYHA